MTNESPWGPRTSGKSKPESPALVLVHQISRYGFHHKKKEVFSQETGKKPARTSPTNTTTEPTHKI